MGVFAYRLFTHRLTQKIQDQYKVKLPVHILFKDGLTLSQIDQMIKDPNSVEIKEEKVDFIEESKLDERLDICLCTM